MKKNVYLTILLVNEISDLRKENRHLKETVVDLVLHYDIVKKIGIKNKIPEIHGLTASKKYEIIKIITRSEIGENTLFRSFGSLEVPFYKWYANYLEYGFDGLNPKE